MNGSFSKIQCSWREPSPRYNPGVSSPRSKSRSAWYWILILPSIGLLFPAFYARSAPELFGFPFFYWYQIVWILVTALLTAIAYFASERK
ncbi:hypothetical protein HNQ77_002894 [Silvibacterium bohemicum]|uniref:DUF3311 domain-containing protein n=1 Tax=Silvibacterium bohemicum TaxID=1577686 RepID=A0A841K2S6_9BACT|nr:DUF3311 domain-containing protein [Silvibacterium bohemicum]MBB6144938.1 hypothetical protein [Silvibacterium bohemicum]